MKQPKLLLAIALAALTGATAAHAAAAANGRIVLRPLSPSDLTDYKLPAGTETSGGRSSIGVGTAAYIEAEASGVIASNTTVIWSLTSKPATSGAGLTAGPLGANVPIYEPSDIQILGYQLIGSRVMLRPDLEGQYMITAAITNTSGWKTNCTVTITAGTFLGWGNGCIACHSGSAWVLAPNMSSWTNTEHASMFTRGIDGDPSVGAGYSKNCISCHTVGYDVNTNALAYHDGGFADEAAIYGWTFPATLNSNNWANMVSNYPAVANVANIQCENCHGPGSQHIIFGGQIGNTNTIAVSWDAGNCGQCHDAKSHHINVPEWKNSKHAVSPNQTGSDCVRCHTAQGFANFVQGVPAVSTPYMPITCVACHDPHVVGTNNPHQLRTVAPVTLADNSTVSGYGTGQLCMDCHHARTSATNMVATFAQTGSRFGPHHGPQGDMFLGVNGYTYGKNIPSSAHRDSIGDACVTCHMQTTTNSGAYLLAGTHTWEMSFTNASGVKVPIVDACQTCHGGSVSTFNLVREDFNGDGIIEGVQTEVQHLLDRLSTLLPPYNTVQTSINPTTNWTKSQLAAAWNWQFVSEDKSMGVHNVAYTVGILKASIADLNGDANSDGLPDSWQAQYFGPGWQTNVNATPNASPAGDGIPNWVKAALNLNPMVAGVAMPDGVVWANAGPSSNGGPLRIYTAAEVTFDTQIGKTYQIQAISQINSTWQNVGNPIAGTGNTMSYLTPTRNDAQQFFRVTHNP